MSEKTNISDKEIDEKKDEKKDEEKDEEKDNQFFDIEPISRKSAKDYIIERKEKKIEQLEKKVKEKYDDYDEENDEKISNIVKSKIEEALNPYKHSLEETNNLSKISLDEAEINELYSKRPQARELDKYIRKYMNSPTYNKVAVEDIYLLLAAKSGKFQQAINDANDQANMSKVGGHSKQIKEEKLINYSNMSDEEFKKIDEEEARKRFNK